MLIIKYFLLISFSVKYFTWNKHNFFSKNKHEKIYIKKNTQILQVFDFIKQWLCDQILGIRLVTRKKKLEKLTLT
jgi:hypothetical protein